MNRLWYGWCEGHLGATGEAPSGPCRIGPVLAASEECARAKLEEIRTSWDGTLRKVTTEEHYRPVKVVHFP